MRSLYDIAQRGLLRDHSNIIFTFWVLLSVSMAMLFRWNARLAETVYGHNIYPCIRTIYDHTLGLIPWPSVYFLLPLWLIYLFHAAFKKGLRHGGFLIFGKRFVLLITFFYWLWAFNYMRPDLKDKLGLIIPQVDEQDFICFFEHHCYQAQSLVDQMNDSFNNNGSLALRSEVAHWLKNSNLEHPGKPPIRLLRPAGLLLGISTAGIYFPYSLEPHIDSGLHPFVQPVTIAHELGHAFGITDEGECNFVGAMVCLASEKAEFRYSAHLQIVRWSFYPLMRLGYEPEDLRMMIGDDVLEHIRRVQEHHDSFPEYFPYEWRNLIYHTYLKAQGVESGLDSYGEVLGMLMADYLTDIAM